MLVTFSGLDGAGKSTLIRGVRGELEASGRSVRVLTMYDDIGVYAAVRMIRDRVAGRPAQPASADANNGDGSQSAFVRIVRSRRLKRGLYGIDLLIFRLLRAYHESFRGRVLIMDRYFYDSIVDLAEDRDDAELADLLRGVPKPDVPVYVQASPEVAFARKHEYSVERLRARQGVYSRLFVLAGTPLIVPNEGGGPNGAIQTIAARIIGKLP
jgi:hypothetical protein